MTPAATAARGSRPPTIPPIIPAVPRKFERKRKEENVLSTLQDVQDLSASVVALTPGHETSKEDESSKPIHNLQSAISTVKEESQDLTENSSIKPESESSRTSPNAIQDLGIGFKLPPVFYPRKSPPAAVSTDSCLGNGHSTPFQHSFLASDDTNDNIVNQRHPESNSVDLSAQGYQPDSFQSDPTRSTNAFASLTRFSFDVSDAPQTVPFRSQATSFDDTVSPTHAPPECHDHSHNVSFYAASSLPSNDPSSPTNSTFQGYAMGPPPQAPNFYGYQPKAEAPFNQYYGIPPAYYSQTQPYPILGSQPPLTPSATPQETMPRYWSFLNGVPPHIPSAYDHDSSPIHSAPKSRRRSSARSTLKSGSPLGRNAETLALGTQLTPESIAGYNNRTQSTPILSSNEQLEAPSDEISLANQVLLHFNNPQYADSELLVTHEEKIFGPISYSLHSLVISRSPKLRGLLNLYEGCRSATGKKFLHLTLTDRSITPKAIDFALRLCYGEPLANFTASIEEMHLPRARAELSASRMRESLAFAAMGHLLQLKSIVLRGLGLAAQILDWDNLEVALSFALQCGIHRENNYSAAVTPVCFPLSARSCETSPSKASSHDLGSSQDPSTGSAYFNASGPGDSSGKGIGPAKVRFAWGLLLRALEFIAMNLSSDWELDLRARPLADVDRLPVTAETRSPLSKSRLSNVQFGDYPTEYTTTTSSVDTLVSSIVFSLSFVSLRHLVSLGGNLFKKQLRDIIMEREKRRQTVLHSQSTASTEREAATLHEWAEVGYEEFVLDQDGELKLSRKFTGIHSSPPEN